MSGQLLEKITWSIAVVALFVVSGLHCQNVRADVEVANWVAPNAWVYKIKFMPDFDQRRVGGTPPGGGPFVFGLPGNPENPLSGGGMYCVPTSAYNRMAYIASHGFPEVAPGPNPSWYWQTQTPYNDVTFDLIDMGVLMGTSGTGGTGGTGQQNGVTDWLFNSGALSKFTVTQYYYSSNFAPTLTNMGKTAINGSIVDFGYGRYNNAGQPFGLQALGERTGGHVITFVHGARVGEERILGARDPADDPDWMSDFSHLYNQSPFGTRYFNVTDQEIFLCIAGDCSQPGTFLNYNPDAEKVALIDGYQGIRPKQGYAWVNSNEQPLILIYTPWTFLGSNLEPSTQIQLPDGLNTQQVAPMPDFDGFYVLCEDAAGLPPQLLSVDSQTGETTEIMAVPGAIDMTVGSNRQIYVTTENELLCLQPNIEKDPPVVASALLPEPADAMAFNDATGDVVLLSSTDQVLMFFRKELPAGVPPTMQELPEGLMLGDHIAMSAEPMMAGERIWIASNAKPVVYALRKGNPDYLETVPIPDGSFPISVAVDDAGHLFINTENGMVEFMFTAAAGWQPVPDEKSEFNAFDIPDGAPFFMTTSRTNFDPAIHNQPGWVTNIDPDDLEEGEIVIDCVADSDDDGMVGISDLLALLSAWGPCDICIMDLDENREIGVGDLLELLSAWGPCE